MSGRKVCIENGDDLPALAAREGFFVQTLWDHPENAALKALRKRPTVLKPGDEVFVPERCVKQVTIATGRRHVFRRRGIPAVYRIQLLKNGRPRAARPYRFDAGGRVQEGTTDSDGVVELWLVPGTREGDLYLPEDDFQLHLAFGTLQPVAELKGIQQRLKNLGFDCGEPDGVMSDTTREAVRAFQRRAGLPDTGEADEATRAALQRLHDERGAFPAPKA